MNTTFFYKVYPSEKHLSEVAIRYKKFSCSYCETRMKISVVPVKRNVPQGAKDLGIYDNVICWKCPRCEATSTNLIKVCGCGHPFYFNENFKQAIYLLKAKSLSERVPFFSSQLIIVQNHDIEEADYLNRHWCGCIHCIKCKICDKPLENQGRDLFMSSRYRELEDYGSQAENSYYHKLCLEQKLQQIESHRIKNNICMTCGKALGIVDRLSGRQEHKRC